MIFTAEMYNAIDLRDDWITRRYMLLPVQIVRIPLSYLVNNKIRKCLRMPIKIRPHGTGDFFVVGWSASVLVIYALFLRARRIRSITNTVDGCVLRGRDYLL